MTEQVFKSKYRLKPPKITFYFSMAMFITIAVAALFFNTAIWMRILFFLGFIFGAIVAGKERSKADSIPAHIKLTDHSIIGYNEADNELLSFSWDEIIKIRRNNFLFESQGAYLISDRQQKEFYIGYFIKGYRELLQIIKAQATNCRECEINI